MSSLEYISKNHNSSNWKIRNAIDFILENRQSRLNSNCNCFCHQGITIFFVFIFKYLSCITHDLQKILFYKMSRRKIANNSKTCVFGVWHIHRKYWMKIRIGTTINVVFALIDFREDCQWYGCSVPGAAAACADCWNHQAGQTRIWYFHICYQPAGVEKPHSTLTGLSIGTMKKKFTWWFFSQFFQKSDGRSRYGWSYTICFYY